MTTSGATVARVCVSAERDVCLLSSCCTASLYWVASTKHCLASDSPEAQHQFMGTALRACPLQTRLQGPAPSCSSACLPSPRCRRSAVRTVCQASATATATSDLVTLGEEYNKLMARQMQWDNPYEYHPERGLYFHEVSPNLICGTQPRSAADISTLASLGFTHIINLQTDKDMQHWSTPIGELQRRAQELGVKLIRRPARDFDPQSLRKTLPAAVSAVHMAISEGGRVYVHCTAGLGRAPAVCIAYMYWFVGGYELDSAYKALTDIRPCGPKRDAIRGATHDLLSRSPPTQFEQLDPKAWATLAPEDRFALQWRVLRGAEAAAA